MIFRQCSEVPQDKVRLFCIHPKSLQENQVQAEMCCVLTVYLVFGTCILHDKITLTYEPHHDKTIKMRVRPAKTQISLGVHSFCWFCHVMAHIYDRMIWVTGTTQCCESITKQYFFTIYKSHSLEVVHTSQQQRNLINGDTLQNCRLNFILKIKLLIFRLHVWTLL